MAQRIVREQKLESDTFDCGTWQRVFQLLWEHKKIVAPLILLSTILVVTDVIMPLLNRYALNTYVNDQTGADTLPVFILVYIGMILVQCLLVHLFLRLTTRMESDFGKNLREKCFRKLQEQTFSCFSRTANGWLMARITSDTTRLVETLTWAPVDVVWGIFVILEISIATLLINWQMALRILVVVSLLWFASPHFYRHTLSTQRQSRKANPRITASSAEGINGTKTTKTLDIEQQNYNELRKKANGMKRYSIRALRINIIFQPIIYSLSAIVIALLLYVGGGQALLETIQLGTLTMFINYAQLLFDPLGQIARVLVEIQAAQASAERMVALLKEEIEITDCPDVTERYGILLKEYTDIYGPLYGDVVFDHVNFYYYENGPVLHDFCLRVEKGQTVALVGEAGSEKSTIIDLLCCFYEPYSGCILTGGKNLRGYSVGWLHSRIGYILQTPSLFSSTMRDNIRYGHRDASDEEVEQIARLIRAHDFVSRTEKGYDTEVGKGGGRLSAGQKQLISFARTMLCSLAIVTLDEAASSIDTKGERVIQYAMDQLLHGCTSFVVVHRLSTIVSADIIVMLQHGVIIRQGTHEELMVKQGYYYELFISQYHQERIQRCME